MKLCAVQQEATKQKLTKDTEFARNSSMKHQPSVLQISSLVAIEQEIPVDSHVKCDQTHRKHVVQTFKPTPESNSFQRPKTDMNVASGCPQFAKLNLFDDPSYVKDDVMYIKCIVDTSKIFHP